jgi:hypothetical protein
MGFRLEIKLSQKMNMKKRTARREIIEPEDETIFQFVYASG